MIKIQVNNPNVSGWNSPTDSSNTVSVSASRWRLELATS